MTNRRLCGEDFLERIGKVAAVRPAGMILREKDLTEPEYKALARRVMGICKEYEVLRILHSFVDTAAELEAEAIHLPLPVLREMTEEQKARFPILGASCHSAKDAVEAQLLGCTYITAGHIFATDCKRGLQGRGLAFLRDVCRSVTIPVYAIGGIAPDNIGPVRGAGAEGACVMSGLMQCVDVAAYWKEFEKRGEENAL